MKRRTIQTIGIYAVFLCLQYSCKSAKITREEPVNSGEMIIKEGVITTPPIAIKIPPPAPDTIKYTYLVSFFSPGDGIDVALANTFDAFLRDESRSSGGKISYQRVPWGREGELDYCILVKGLPDRERKAFDAALREKISGSKKVNVYENQVCRFLKAE